jgi:DNA recombination protein RmuC
MAAGVVVAIVVVAALGVVVAWLARALRALQAGTTRTVVERTSDVDRRLGSLQETFDRRLADMDDKVGRRLEGIDGRLLATQRSTGETTTQIVEKLGRLDTSAAQMLARANDLSRLEQALRPPKARGGVGELLLGNLLRDCLPGDAYQLQYGFAGGERVDAVIKVQRLLPVDAKFPLENFLRITDASDGEEQLAGERAFARDVKGHVDAIASKYIRPAEGTFDFAFMYLPSEAVYYELVCGKTGDLYGYALGKRVFPVSPSTFHAYLQMILLGLKGLQIEQHAHDVMAYCAQLAKEFERFETDFDVVGKHLTNAQSKWAEAGTKLDRLGLSLEQATRWELEQAADETVAASVRDEDDDPPAPLAVRAA